MNGVSSSSNSSAMHLNSSGLLTSSSKPISSVQVHPAALFAILDHYLRRPNPIPIPVPETEDSDPSSAQSQSQPRSMRVIGTLLGSRTLTEVSIKSAFAVPHLEDSDQVQVDMQYLKEMLDLHLKANPNELVVGWYSTGENLKLDAYSALIHDYYSKESLAGQAVHLTFDTNVKDENLGVKAYYASPLGITPRPTSTIFVPLPLNLQVSSSEKSSFSLLENSNDGNSPVSDMEALSTSLKSVQVSLERVLNYVRQVIKGERKGDVAVGRFVMEAVGSVNMGKTGVEGEELENLFNSHLQDVLMISYLANVIRAQAEVSSRLQLLT